MTDDAYRHRLSPTTPYSSDDPRHLFHEEERRQIQEDLPHALEAFLSARPPLSDGLG